MKRSLSIVLMPALISMLLSGCFSVRQPDPVSTVSTEVEIGVPIEHFVDRLGDEHGKDDLLTNIQSIISNYREDSYIPPNGYDVLPDGMTIPEVQAAADYTLFFESQYTLAAEVLMEGGYRMAIYYDLPDPKVSPQGLWLESAGVSFLQDATEDTADGTFVTLSFGSYTVPAGWSKLDEISTEQKPFYVKEGTSADSVNSNISVEVGENQYAKEEHSDFKRAILQQLAMQLGSYADQTGKTHSELTGDGFTSDKGELVYKFTVEWDDFTVIQYYIVEDYRFCMVYATDYKDPQISDVDATVLAIVNSFEWL